MDAIQEAPFASGAAASSVVFWSGSGISRDEPTNGPLGPELTARALDGFLLGSTRAELRDLYRELGVPNADARPRLETVLASVRDIYGAPGLASILRDVAAAVPNRHHRWFR